MELECQCFSQTEMDERSFVTKDETSGKTLTSNSRTARLGTRSVERTKACLSLRAQGLEADFYSIPLNWTLKHN